MLKQVFRMTLVVGLLVAVGLVTVSVWGQVANSVIAQAEEKESQHEFLRTITVVGQGSVRTEPDVARVSIGVETSAEAVNDAVAENGLKMEAILDALEAQGIEDKDIQTMQYSIQIDRHPVPTPRTLEEGSEEEQPNYRVSNVANVTVRDLDSVGDVLDAAVEAGANNVWGVSFTVDDPEAARSQARADAVADAEARATELAELGGVSLGPVMSMSEILSGGGMPVGLAAERAMGGAGPISPGEVEIGYSLQVVYFIEP